jgi:hypothetical protein
MSSLLFWLYVLNLTLLILHEMDSTYWKEWDLFHLPGGQAGFLLVHLPIWPLAIYGAVQVWNGAPFAIIYFLVITAAGLIAFGLHTYFLRTGHPEFDTPISKSILWAMLLVSLAQIIAVFVSSL